MLVFLLFSVIGVAERLPTAQFATRLTKIESYFALGKTSIRNIVKREQCHGNV
jgi:hypothetical protein